MMYENPVRKGSTFLMAPSKNLKQHLYFVLTEPKGDDSDILMVNITSNDSDRHCVIYPDEHNFLKHESYVSWEHAILPKVKALKGAIKENSIFPHNDASQALVDKICQSGCTAQKLKLKYRELLKIGSHSS